MNVVGIAVGAASIAAGLLRWPWWLIVLPLLLAAMMAFSLHWARNAGASVRSQTVLRGAALHAGERLALYLGLFGAAWLTSYAWR